MRWTRNCICIACSTNTVGVWNARSTIVLPRSYDSTFGDRVVHMRLASPDGDLTYTPAVVPANGRMFHSQLYPIWLNRFRTVRHTGANDEITE